MEFPVELAERARKFAAAHHVDLDVGVPGSARHLPVLMPLDDRGRPLVHVSEAGNVDFYLSRVDYFNRDWHVAASRLISWVMPGCHTRSAYLQKSHATKVIEVHKGNGYLILGHSPEEDEDFTTDMYKLDPAVTPAFTVPPGHFYSIEADNLSPEELVVSEVVEINGDGELTNAEVVLDHGQEVIETSDGILDVPEEFAQGVFS